MCRRKLAVEARSAECPPTLSIDHDYRLEAAKKKEKQINLLLEITLFTRCNNSPFWPTSVLSVVSS